MKKVIFKQFIFNNRFYFYEPYYNGLFEISDEIYSELLKLSKIGIIDYRKSQKKSNNYDSIITLINKGLIRESFISKIEHHYTNYLDTLLQRCINDITLQVTRNCNFSCRYCSFTNNKEIQRNHEKKNMSIKIAKKCVDFLYNHSFDTNKVNISFYGGEPLINYKLIYEIVKYSNAKFHSKKIDYSMTINGSLLTKEIIYFLIENNFKLSISIDGPKEIQNFHRKYSTNGGDTFDIVYSNIMLIKEINDDFFSTMFHLFL